MQNITLGYEMSPDLIQSYKNAFTQFYKDIGVEKMAKDGEELDREIYDARYAAEVEADRLRIVMDLMEILERAGGGDSKAYSDLCRYRGSLRVGYEAKVSEWIELHEAKTVDPK